MSCQQSLATSHHSNNYNPFPYTSFPHIIAWFRHLESQHWRVLSNQLWHMLPGGIPEYYIMETLNKHAPIYVCQSDKQLFCSRENFWVILDLQWELARSLNLIAIFQLFMVYLILLTISDWQPFVTQEPLYHTALQKSEISEWEIQFFYIWC